jgi:hypothetical protein
MNKVKKSILHALLMLLPFLLLAMPFSASAAQEEKMLVVGGTWEKDGWNLSVKAVDKTATPGFILISLSYQDKKLGDARIETGKSYTYIGKSPDGSEAALFTVKATIFVGARADAVRLALNWSTPGSGVQIIEVPVESEQMKAETPIPAPTAQTSPKAPGFELFSGIIVLMLVLRKKKEKIKAWQQE